MSFDDLRQHARSTGVVPVVDIVDVALVVPLVDVLLARDVRVIEITLRTEAGLEAINRVATQRPEMLVGAGTVVTPDDARRAKTAGAAFGVAPGPRPDSVDAAADLNWTFVPGVATPTEVMVAMTDGLLLLKLFPAEVLGGSRLAAAMLAPFRHLGLELLPTGGIDRDSAPAYWEIPGVAAVGGSWIAPTQLLAHRAWSAIGERAAATVTAFRERREVRLSSGQPSNRET